MVEIILGIDLGTTYSCMAYVDDAGQPRVIPAVDGGRTTPSVIAFDEFGQCLYGKDAKDQATVNPDRTFRSVKSYMGKTRDELQRIPEYTKYKNTRGELYLPQEISALVLGKLKADAELYLGKQIKKAVITVPAYFNDAQKNATKDAGKIAGLEVIRLISEPTAAAIAYGMDHAGKDQTVLVYDLGGGTFDVSIMGFTTDIAGNEAEMIFDVVSTIGDTHLGGDNFDEKIMEYIFQDIRNQSGVDVSGDPESRQKVKSVAEETKKKLSNIQKASIGINNIGPNHSINYKGTLERDQFEEMIRTYIDRTISLTQKVKSMAGSKMRGFSLDKIILVGGSTKIPAVKQMIETETGKRPAQDINPDECVAIGAALQGRIIALENGWGDDNDHLLVDIPDEVRGNNQYSCLTTNPKKSVTITVYDVTSQDLGVVAVIDGKEDQFSRIIEKNSKIPVRKTDEYFTNRDQQSAIHVQIIQGQDSVLYPDAQDPHNKIIFEADMNITQAARGDYAYIVTFSLDDNGILSVASDEYKTKIDAQGYLHADLSKKTTKKITFNVKLQTGLSQHEIQASQREVAERIKDYKSQF